MENTFICCKEFVLHMATIIVSSKLKDASWNNAFKHLRCYCFNCVSNKISKLNYISNSPTSVHLRLNETQAKKSNGLKSGGCAAHGCAPP